MRVHAPTTLTCARAAVGDVGAVLTRPPSQAVYQDDDEDDGPQPDPALEAGNGLPMRIKPDFPPELVGVPIEDIDPFYQNQRVSWRWSGPL